MADKMFHAGDPVPSWWPRFEDGRPVEVGDLVEGFEVLQISFLPDLVAGLSGCGESIAVQPGQRVSRPALLAKDGKPVKVGEVLYGEDGKAWTVVMLHYGSAYPVDASDGEKGKCLKAEWLVHEKPMDTRMNLLWDSLGISEKDKKVVDEICQRAWDAMVKAVKEYMENRDD